MIGMIGRSVDVNVYVYSEPKYTTISWYKNTTLLKQSAKYSMTENMLIVYDDFHGKEVQLDGYKLTLVIYELRFEDAAVYKLQLSNGIGNLVEHNLVLEIGRKFYQRIRLKGNFTSYTSNECLNKIRQ